MMKASSYPCPCCGYLTFSEPPGSYDICEICFWEDDALQLEFATSLDGGANAMTLEEAQRAFADCGAKARSRTPHTRPAGPLDHRDPGWRPIDRRRDDFANWEARARDRVPAVDERLYYWRETFWRRARAT